MKFEKRLRAEIVPEWSTKYIDYKGLKKRLRHIKSTREKELAQDDDNMDLEGSFLQSGSAQKPFNMNKRYSGQSFNSQQRTFSMTSMASSFFHKLSTALTSVQKQQNLRAPPPQIKSLDTLMDQIRPEERLFFVTLDKELGKIETFYEMKEKEALDRMNVLTQQYEMLKEEKENHPYRSEFRKSKIFARQSFGASTSNLTKAEKHISGPPLIDYKAAKKRIKKALFEFYRGTELLRNYCALNYTGFVKLLKKYDRVSERNGYEVYISKVTNSLFVKSNTMKNLLKEIEDFYIDNFEGGSRSQATRKLRLPDKEYKTYYSSVLRVGFYLGLALPVAIHSLESAWDISWLNSLQLHSGFALPIFMLLLLGINMYIWTKSHINYKFIFELDPRNNLDFRQYLEIPAILFLAISYTMLFNYYYTPNFIPQSTYHIVLAVFIGAVVLNPFHILYYNARRWFVFSMARLFGSGFLRVEFRDFFFADGLTSLAYSLIMVQLFGKTDNGNTYKISDSVWTPILGSIPALFRFLQCHKRYRDTFQLHHLLNLCKYGSIIIATFMAYLFRKALFKKEAMEAPSNGDGSLSRTEHYYTIMLFLWLFTQSIASIYTFSWDVKMDWSLFKLQSVNYLLRDELGYEYHWLYYGAIILNFFLRWSWISVAIWPKNPIVSFVVSLGEVYRRWQWNLFRVENEHINNCEQNRAVKEIPLPLQTQSDVLQGDFEPTMTGTDIESDFDRASSLTSWKKRLFTTNRPKQTSADSLKDFEPRKNVPEYIYDDIYEESDEDSDGEDYYDRYDRRSRAISVIRAEGTHGLSNTYASRSLLPPPKLSSSGSSAS